MEESMEKKNLKGKKRIFNIAKSTLCISKVTINLLQKYTIFSNKLFSCLTTSEH